MSSPIFTNSLSAANIYLRPKVFAILFLGIASGFPFALVAANLTHWLSALGIERKSVFLLTLALIPYNLKFLWAPLIDRYAIPLLTRRFGHRRSWLLFLELGLIAALILFATNDPRENLALCGIAALLVALMGASLDIVIDAYRIESLTHEELGAGAGMANYGWRFGGFAVTTILLNYNDDIGWSAAYLVCGLLALSALVAAVILSEPDASARKAANHSGIVASFIDPVKSFFTSSGSVAAASAILIFILFHKLGDTLTALSLRNLLVSELHFSDKEIYTADVLFGMAAILFGTFIGGILYARMKTNHAILLSLGLIMISNLGFYILALAGRNVWILAASIGFENFSSGIAGPIIVGYLSALCNKSYTASQYAIFSTLASFLGRFASAWNGWAIEALGYDHFYIFTTLICIPGICAYLLVMRLSRGQTQE